MITYEVVVTIEQSLAERFARYMRDKHIPEIFATGCFRAIRFERASDTRFRTRYVAATREDVDRYLRDHTPHFRADFAAHFPTGARAEREVWVEEERWG